MPIDASHPEARLALHRLIRGVAAFAPSRLNELTDNDPKLEQEARALKHLLGDELAIFLTMRKAPPSLSALNALPPNPQPLSYRLVGDGEAPPPRLRSANTFHPRRHKLLPGWRYETWTDPSGSWELVVSLSAASDAAGDQTSAARVIARLQAVGRPGLERILDTQIVEMVGAIAIDLYWGAFCSRYVEGMAEIVTTLAGADRSATLERALAVMRLLFRTPAIAVCLPRSDGRVDRYASTGFVEASGVMAEVDEHTTLSDVCRGQVTCPSGYLLMHDDTARQRVGAALRTTVDCEHIRGLQPELLAGPIAVAPGPTLLVPMATVRDTFSTTRAGQQLHGALDALGLKSGTGTGQAVLWVQGRVPVTQLDGDRQMTFSKAELDRVRTLVQLMSLALPQHAAGADPVVSVEERALLQLGQVLEYHADSGDRLRPSPAARPSASTLVIRFVERFPLMSDLAHPQVIERHVLPHLKSLLGVNSKQKIGSVAREELGRREPGSPTNSIPDLCRELVIALAKPAVKECGQLRRRLDALGDPEALPPARRAVLSSHANSVLARLQRLVPTRDAFGEAEFEAEVLPLLERVAGSTAREWATLGQREGRDDKGKLFKTLCDAFRKAL